jgi:hypothetical protein
VNWRKNQPRRLDLNLGAGLEQPLDRCRLPPPWHPGAATVPNFSKISSEKLKTLIDINSNKQIRAKLETEANLHMLQILVYSPLVQSYSYRNKKLIIPLFHGR